MTAPVLIVGTGALATLFAAQLASSGVGVTMLGTWEQGLQALASRGARVVLPGDKILHGKVRVISNPAEARGINYALVLVKSWQTEGVARQLAGCLAQDGLALTLQNGLGNDVVLADYLGVNRTAAGITTTGAALVSPGLARYGGEGSINLGNHPRLQPFTELLSEVGFTVQIHADLRSIQWGKLVVNSAINPLTALLGVRNGELLEIPAARAYLQQTADETARIAEAIGLILPFDDPVKITEDVARRTAANVSSMLQDLRRGAPTEIQAINGAVVREAAPVGLHAPHNQQLVRWIQRRVAQPDLTRPLTVLGRFA
jgi:2-dehydropantoate 2-reductase